MKKIVMVLCWLLPMLSNAQQNQGIAFQTLNNWQALLAKAKLERKNIFIDAFATWCGPCKKMDADVYTNQKIGFLMNPGFISVKIQFDQNKNDSEHTKTWYADAKFLSEKYHIQAFPMFIFLTPDGDLISQDAGFRDVEGFSRLIKKVKDPDSNYSHLIELFHSNKIKADRLLDLSLTAKNNNDSIAVMIAKKYKDEVLEKKDPSKTLNTKVGDFIIDFQQIFTIKDKLVNFMLYNAEKADLLIGEKNFSARFTDYLITKTEIYPTIMPNGKYSLEEPNWTKLQQNLTKSFGKLIAVRVLVPVKPSWYINKKDWPKAVKYTVQDLETRGIDTTVWAGVSVNSTVFNIIFKHSDNPVYLEKGIKYMQILLKAHPDFHTWIDTYANLLYKIGRKQEALEQEHRALSLAFDLKDKLRIPMYKDVIKKMQNSERTWP